MTSRDFCYWLQGALELSPDMALTPAQMLVVRAHLNLVFIHEIDTPDPTGKLQATHDGEGVKKLDEKMAGLEKSLKYLADKNTAIRC